MISEGLASIKLALLGVNDALGAPGPPVLTIKTLLIAGVNLIERFEAMESSVEDLEDLASEAATLAYQYSIVLQKGMRNGCSADDVLKCVNNLCRTLNNIIAFLDDQHKKQAVQSKSRFRRAIRWFLEAYNSNIMKNRITGLRTQLRRDSNAALLRDPLIILSPPEGPNAPWQRKMYKAWDTRSSITATVPLPVQARNPNDVLPYFDWMKTVIIEKWGTPAFTRYSASVLDMMCGQGNDLTRWQKACATEYVGVDSDSQKIASAQNFARRARSSERPLSVEFVVSDCFDRPLSDKDYDEVSYARFDIVSLQSGMHQVWRSEARAKQTLKNIANSLRRGGRFIGMMHDGQRFLEKLGRIPQNREPSFGNTAYKVTFPSRDGPTFGRSYKFAPFGSFEDKEQFVIPWGSFVSTATQFKLHLKEVIRSEELFQKMSDEARYRHLLIDTKVVNVNGSLCMDVDQWEAANLYIAFVFVKE